MRHVAKEHGVGFSTDGFEKERPQIREVVFLDTADFRLYGAEVIFGCVVGIGVSWIIPRTWPVLPPRPPAAEAGKEA